MRKHNRVGARLGCVWNRYTQMRDKLNCKSRTWERLGMSNESDSLNKGVLEEERGVTRALSYFQV